MTTTNIPYTLSDSNSFQTWTIPPPPVYKFIPHGEYLYKVDSVTGEAWVTSIGSRIWSRVEELITDDTP